jgi:hypothetical protein
VHQEKAKDHRAGQKRIAEMATLGMFLVVLAACADISVAAATGPDRKTVIAGHYPAGGIKRSVLGGGYRDLWGTPFLADVLDLQMEAGGLTPVFRVGGQQTMGLALIGADGRSYTFRGLEKDASHVLDFVDPELWDTPIARMINDLMSAQHPASELVASGILEAIGMPCPGWRLVVLPDDEALGEFREELAGAVGVFAPYPQPKKGDLPGFLGATDIIDHLTLYALLEAGEGEVDSLEFLKARLVDIFMGDWDRHRRQWRWAKVPGNPRWVPIPEDRDQAFSRYDGFVMKRVRGADPRFQDFGPDFSNIGGLTFNGADQDRRLLVELTCEEFVATAAEIQAQLTDEAIEDAVRRMPAEWYAIDGARLNSALKARRDALTDIAVEYHHHLARRVDVYLTDRQDHVEAKRLENGDLAVTVTTTATGSLGRPYFSRVFDGEETDEVRFYALDGDDKINVTGSHKGVYVRVVGGKGDDTLDATGAGRAKLSDSEGQNRALDAQYDNREYTPPPPPENAPWVPPRDWTRETVGIPIISFTGDLGLFLGYGVQIQKFGFRKNPYATAHRIRGGWSFKRGSGRIDYAGEFLRENRASSFGLFAFASGVEVLRFFGFGNETSTTADQEFYKVIANQYVVYPTFKVPFAGKASLNIGPALKYTQSDETKDQFINVVQPYGMGNYGALAVHAILSWEGRDNVVFPRKGIFAALRASYFAKAWDVESDFSEVNGNVNAYLSVGQAATLAVRLGGKKVYGTFPYMEGAAIGSGGLGSGALAQPENTVRGYQSRRFLGDASAWANGELRLRISNITLILPGDWGVSGFGDVGRVWLDGESSDKWHAGVGGGLWVSLLSDRMAFSATIAQGEEDTLFYFSSRFTF